MSNMFFRFLPGAPSMPAVAGRKWMFKDPPLSVFQFGVPGSSDDKTNNRYFYIVDKINQSLKELIQNATSK